MSVLLMTYVVLEYFTTEDENLFKCKFQLVKHNRNCEKIIPALHQGYILSCFFS